MPNIFLARFLLPALAALALTASVVLTTLQPAPAASMLITPTYSTPMVGDSFTIDVIVSADVPVNAYRGLFTFDDSKLQIMNITYNTEVADLWVKEPWYSNGDGTFAFAGGTTKPGGFSGEDTLLTITFNTLASGEALVEVAELQILKHDGLGSDVTDHENSIDGVFAIAPEAIEEIVVNKTQSKKPARIIPLGRSPDLNRDGAITITDVSIFMGHLTTQDIQSDFNGDETVNTKDLSIILREL